jgi:hypothetical protein
MEQPGRRDLLWQKRCRKHVQLGRLHQVPLDITRPTERLCPDLFHLLRFNSLDGVIHSDWEIDPRDKFLVQHCEIGETRDDVAIV